MTAFMPDVKPSTSILHDYNAFSRHCHESQHPVVVTKNGEADLVVMSVEVYQKMITRQKLGQMLGKVDREIAAGAPMRDFEEVFALIDKRIEDAPGVERGYRYMLVNPYIVFYRVMEDAVIIARVLHTRQNWLHMLFGAFDEE